MADKIAIQCRAPLLWLVFPLIVGYILARISPIERPVWLLIFALPFIAITWFLLRPSSQKLWAVCFIVGIIALAWSYFLLRWDEPAADWKVLPPREAELSLEVTEPFDTGQRFNRTSGLAKVVGAPLHLSDLIGLRVFFDLELHPDETRAIRSTQWAVRGVLSYFDTQASDSSFHRYLNSRGVFFQLNRGLVVGVEQPANVIFQFCAEQNQRLEALLRRSSEGHTRLADVAVAMLLGKKSALSREQKDVFLETGVMHLFAISGLHVGVIAMILFHLLGLIRLPRPLIWVLGLLLLLLYVFTTGGRPSALRAFSMVAFFWGAYAFRQKNSPFSALLASALVVLIVDPTQLWNAGFQMSYAVVASIFLYGLPLSELLCNRLKLFVGLPQELWQWQQRLLQTGLKGTLSLFAVGLGAWMMSTPLSIHYFNVFAPGALALNLMLLPLATGVIICCFLALLFGLISLVELTSFWNHGAWLLIAIMENSLQWSQESYLWFSRRVWLAPWFAFATTFILFCTLLIGHSHRYIRFSGTYIAPLILLCLLVLAFTQAVG